MHCANVTGEWNEVALAAMANMSYVTFESGHKMFASPPMDQEEAKIIESCKLVKQRSNNRTSCIMYTEADFARLSYSLGHALDAHPEEELHCKGVLQEWGGYQKAMDPNTKVWYNYSVHAYDYGNPAGAERWIERATNTVASGWVDGVYLDGMPYPAWTNNGVLANCTPAERTNWSAGFNRTVRELAHRLGPDGIIIANGVLLPEYKHVATGWMDDQTYGEDIYNQTCGVYNQPCLLAYHTPWTGSAQSFAEGLTSFLLGLQPFQYFATGEAWSGGGGGSTDHNPWAPGIGAQACDTWLQDHAEYHRALGTPKGVATVRNDSWPKIGPGSYNRCAKDGNRDQNINCQVWTREFEHAKVYQGQFVDPNCTANPANPKLVSCKPLGNCIYWDDNTTTGEHAYCPPRNQWQAE